MGSARLGITFFAARQPGKQFLANGVFGSLVANDASLAWLIRRADQLRSRYLELQQPWMTSGPLLFDDLEIRISQASFGDTFGGEEFLTLAVVPTQLFYPFSWVDDNLPGCIMQPDRCDDTLAHCENPRRAIYL